MISHTVRVFKLMYIVAGILISNEEICDTVDRIQIAPRVEVKQPEMEQLTQKSKQKQSNQNIQKSTTPEQGRRPGGKRKISVTQLAGGMMNRVTDRFSWLRKFDLRPILQQWRIVANSFNMWTIPNYLVEHTSSYISRKFFINSDCDMIYK